MRYFIEKNKIDPELLNQKAYEQAKKFHNPGKSEKRLTPSQLRRFYGEFKRLETQFDNEKNFASILPLIKMQISKSAYAANPKQQQQKVPKSFHEFIEDNVKSISTEEDFKAFMLYFEAVVGFFYWNEGHGIKNN